MLYILNGMFKEKIYQIIHKMRLISLLTHLSVETIYLVSPVRNIKFTLDYPPFLLPKTHQKQSCISLTIEIFPKFIFFFHILLKMLTLIIF